MPAPSIHVGVRSQILAVLVLALLAVGASAAPPTLMPPQKKDTPKTVKFAMKDKTWREVFEWLAETTGKPMITAFYPEGKFTFAGPADKEYTIPEVIDIIHSALMSNRRADKYHLINRQRAFTLIPADELDLVYCPRIRPEELGEHGNTEIVSMVLPLKSLDVKRLAPFLRKLSGPYGEVIPLSYPSVNSLIMFDSVGNLKRICGLVMFLDKADPFPHLPLLAP